MRRGRELVCVSVGLQYMGPFPHPICKYTRKIELLPMQQGLELGYACLGGAHSGIGHLVRGEWFLFGWLKGAAGHGAHKGSCYQI